MMVSKEARERALTKARSASRLPTLFGYSSQKASNSRSAAGAFSCFLVFCPDWFLVRRLSSTRASPAREPSCSVSACFVTLRDVTGCLSRHFWTRARTLAFRSSSAAAKAASLSAMMSITAAACSTVRPMAANFRKRLPLTRTLPTGCRRWRDHGQGGSIAGRRGRFWPTRPCVGRRTAFV